MKIGIISDTHDHLDENVFSHFQQCDEIWHAGDIGTISLLEQLEGYKPTKAVYGNIDGAKVRSAVPENQLLKREGKSVLITHIAGKPPRYNVRVRNLIAEHRPDILVCGHSHFLRIEQDQVNNLLFINPGAAGKQGFHKVKTLLRFEIEKGQVFNMEVIELGKRGRMA